MVQFDNYQFNIIGLVTSYIAISVLSFFSHMYLTEGGEPILVLSLISFVAYMLTIFGYYILQHLSVSKESEEMLIINFTTFGFFISAVSLAMAESISKDIFIFSENSIYLVVGITTGLVGLIVVGALFITRKIWNN